MDTRKDPKEIAEAILNRSVCSIQVGACLVDNWGVHSWGWNHSGPDGFGLHAEEHCLRRANRRRAVESTMYVAARRRRNSKIVTAKPCVDCQCLIQPVWKVVYRDADGEWKDLR